MSLLPLSTCAAVTEAVPDALRFTDTSLHNATGAVTSKTVTVAVHCAVLPESSVTVSVTVFAPTSAHVKLVCESVRLATPQLSALPLFTCAAVTVAAPDAFRFTVTSWHNAVGSRLSTTVTTASHVAVLLFPSVTVNVTVFAPRSAHVKSVCESDSVTEPRSSVLPLSTCAAVTVAAPDASRFTVTSWHNAVGSVVSSPLSGVSTTSVSNWPPPRRYSTLPVIDAVSADSSNGTSNTYVNVAGNTGIENHTNSRGPGPAVPAGGERFGAPGPDALTNSQPAGTVSCSASAVIASVHEDSSVTDIDTCAPGL